jgi:hypothetical protein
VSSYPTIDAVSTSRTRIVLVDDDVLFREGLAGLLGRLSFDHRLQDPAAVPEWRDIATDHPPVASPAEPGCGLPSGPKTPAQIPAPAGAPRVQQAG